MNLKSVNNFNEAKLGENFAKDKLKEYKQLIEAGTSFVAISMPGVGASYFLKYLACSPSLRLGVSGRAHFIHIDLYSLPSLNLHEFYKLLLTELGGKTGSKSDEELFLESKKLLKEIALKNKKVVLIFNRFDQIKSEIDYNFLSNLQSLTSDFAGKIVLIFTSIKPLSELTPEAVVGGNLTFYSKHLYFKPYSESDLKMLLEINPEPTPKDSSLGNLLKLSGGHYQLLKILLNSQKQQNLSLDQFVRLQMKGLIDYLDYSQKKQIQKVASKASHTKLDLVSVDDYLLGVGMVKENLQLFTPLLAEYVKQTMVPKLPPREAKLFKLLKENIGKTVSKDEIFETVWPARNASSTSNASRSDADWQSDAGGEDSENATDWALDALVYRLRKHSFVKTGGYIIESQKKIGYTLIQT